MIQNELKTAVNYAEIGEAISHELGAKMVKDYHDKYPEETKFFYIGKNIIDQILSQPGCVGMSFYRAINEEGNQTLVYLGHDATGKAILEYSIVGTDGRLTKIEALVGDRNGTSLDWFAK